MRISDWSSDVCSSDLLFPGDPALAMAGEEHDPVAIAQIREKYNLNKPLPVRYWLWISGVVRGDFGESIRIQLPVSPLLADKLPVTLELTVLAMLVALLIGMPAEIGRAHD